jgi:AraC family transcriptional regulator
MLDLPGANVQAAAVIETKPSSRPKDRTMTTWCADVTTSWAAFSLHPPVPFALDSADARYRCLLTFGSGIYDLALENTPLLRRRARAGCVIFVEPRQRLIMRSVDVFEFLLISIDPGQMRRLADAAAMGQAWHAHTLLDYYDPGLSGLGAETRRALLSDALPLQPYLQSLADAIVLRLLCHFLNSTELSGSSATLSPALLRRLVHHIDTHLAEHLTVEQLAAMGGLTRSHFSRAFRRMTGDPPQRFIIKRRVCRARDLLMSADASLADIAARTGFSSQAHFSTVFCREVGTTPARYRSAFRSRGDSETRVPIG